MGNSVDAGCPSQCRYRVDNRSKSSLSDVEARGHVSDHVAVELITGDTAQLAKDGLAVTEDIDIGIGGIKSNGLIRIEDEVPGTGLMLDGVERAGSLERCHSGLGVKGERYIAGARRGTRRPIEQRLGRFVEGIGAAVVAKHVPDHCPPTARTEQLCDLGQRRGLAQPMESGCGDAETERGGVQDGLLEHETITLSASSGMVSRR